MDRSSAAINERHNAVLRVLAHHSRLLYVQPRIEPRHLSARDDSRPDIQVDLPDLTLLGDVTISHPLAKRWRQQTAARGVESVGDDREAEKNDSYAQMAAELDMHFSAIVLYTYGGFHHTTLSFIQRLGGALDPATCLMSLTEWKRSIKEHIAIAVQRGTADIMIRESQRVRAEAIPRRRRRTRRTSRQQPPAPLAAAVARDPLRAGSRAVVVADRLIIPPTPCSSDVDVGEGEGAGSGDSLDMVPGTPGEEVLDIVCDNDCARGDVYMRDAAVVDGARLALDGRSAPTAHVAMRCDVTSVVGVDVGVEESVVTVDVSLFPGRV